MIFRKGLKDYKLYQDAAGRDAYLYTGDYYVWDMPEDKRRTVKAALALAMLFEVLITYFVGKSARAAFLRLYAVIPFLFAVFFAVWGLSGAFNLVMQKEKMTLNQYSVSLKRMSYCAMGLAVSSGAMLIALIVHWSVEGKGNVPPAVLSALLTAVSAGIYLYIHKKMCIFILDKTIER